MPKNAPRKLAFTKKRLEALSAPERGRVYYNDTETAGLCLCVTEAGSKTFYYTKKVAGTTERIRLATFPDGLTVEQARTLVKTLNLSVASGHDPQQAKRERREEPTFGDLWQHWIAHAKGRKRPRSIEEDERQWKLHLSGWTGRRLSSIKKTDVAALHARISQERLAPDSKQRRGGPYQANRTLALVKAMFGKAEGIGWKGDNPAVGIEPFPEKSRDRFLMPDELPRFFEALAAEPNPILQGFFLLCLLTGARRSNVQAMGWSEISFELKQWRIPETKAGMAVVVPLSPLALETLEKLREYRRDDCPWVFPGRRQNGGHLITPGFAWKRLLARAGLKDLRIHDLRRSMGSWMAIQGTSLSIIGKLLGHKRAETTQIYARLNLDPVVTAVEGATAAIVAAKERNGNGITELQEEQDRGEMET